VSTWLRYLENYGEQLPFPSNGYRGDYVRPLAEKLRAKVGESMRHSAGAVLLNLPPDAPIGEGTRFEQGMVHEAFRAVFVEGQPWEATRWFKYNLGLIRKGRVLWECRNAEELLARLNREVRSLYASMAQHGFLRQEEIAARADREPEVFARFAGEDYHSSLSPTHEIKLGVNENGRLLFLDGRHRLAIAKLLGIVRIPVRVVFVHPEYVRRHRPEAATDPAAMTAIRSQYCAARLRS